MKIFLRLLKYAAKYKKRFLTGVLLSLVASILNGISLGALKPIFAIMAEDKMRAFQVEFSDNELSLLASDADVYTRIEALFSKDKRYQGVLERITAEKPAPPDTFAEKFNHQIGEWKLSGNEFFIQYAPFDLLVLISLVVFPIYFLKLLTILGTVYFISSSGLLVVKDIRADLNKKVLNLPIQHFVQERVGSWMSRVINDVMLLSEAISHDLRISINNLFLVITHTMLLALLNYKLLLISFVGVPILLWPVNNLARKIKGITRNEQSRLAELNAHMQEMIAGIRVIRAFNMEGYESSRFMHVNDQLWKESFRHRMNHTLGPSLVEFVSSLIVIGLIVYGGQQIVGGHFSASSFLTFLFTLMVIMSPIKQLATWYNIMNRSVAAASRVFEIIDMDSEPHDPNAIQEMGPIKKGIFIKNVSFRYPDTEKEVLKKISLDAPAGSTVALVGHSGAGKSTFVDLLSRFYDPVKGSIKIDGTDIRKLTLQALRSKIGIVTQEIFLFNATIRENIAYGRADIPIEQIIKTAKTAYAHDFIMELPEQYETVIGERGMILSGGQRQRLSIARALLKDPEILILDEATSALDTNSERLVQKALEVLMKKRTTFVIAHRLSTIYQADKIVVFDKGKIVEEGDHQTLIEKNGAYKALYDLQFQT